VLNNRSIAFASLFVSLNLLLGCQQDAPPAAEKKTATTTAPVIQQHTIPASSATSGTIISTLNASGYTYVQVDTGKEKIWLAGPNTTLVTGGQINVNTSVPMRNFRSKTLNRDFPVLYFVDRFSGNAVQGAGVAHAAPKASVTDWSFDDNKSAAPAVGNSSAKPLEKVADGYTTAEIVANKKELSGKLVKVRGKVTKFTGGIMRKNWIHLEDGSGGGDLIAITQQVVSAGQTVVVEGKVALDRDFGYGYFYELLIEDATVTVEN